MNFSEEIKNLRRQTIKSQSDFAKEIGVSFSTVNRWETGRTIPNYKTMQAIESYCANNNLDSTKIRESWEALL